MNENNDKPIRLNIDELKGSLEKFEKHTFSHVKDILPFTGNHSVYYEQNFQNVMAYFVQNILQEKVKQNKEEVINVGLVRDLIEEKVSFNLEEDKSKFFNFLRKYLFVGDRIKPIHPYLYIYTTSNKSNKNIKNYGGFMYDLIAHESDSLINVFQKESDNVLLELLFTSLEKIKTEKFKREQEYRPLLPRFSKLYIDDIVFLRKHQSYFLKSFVLLTRYYLFMYVCQLIFKFEQFEKANFNEIIPLYFALDWESVSTRRNVADQPFTFKWIREHSEFLFPHVHTMAHLSTNTFNEKTNNKYEFWTYKDLYEYYLVSPNKKKFIDDINEWINCYPKLRMVKKKFCVNNYNETIEDAFRSLHHAITKGMNEDYRIKYGKHIELLGRNHFIKSRGRLGLVYNLTHDFLMLLTAVSVKDRRLPVSDLFKEYEKRGVGLDDRSKEEVIRYLDSLNYIDKKSDSGDARYVKPIL